MMDNQEQKSKPAAKSAPKEREARLAAALRANLRRRKAPASKSKT
jgi:hypothetical protein